jgi:cation diffusion facilitator CzcD-associated flavoprotein CzcO
VTARGLKTRDREVELDAVIFATGFDGLTGAMLAFEILGRNGRSLQDKWRGGSRSYLGLLMEDFPNLFMVCGANGPAVLANIVTMNEQNVDWICDCIDHMRSQGLATVEATAEAEAQWMETVAALAELTLVSKANTWYVGANIEGKPRGLTLYTGGFHRYREICANVAANGWRGLSFEKARSLEPA